MNGSFTRGVITGVAVGTAVSMMLRPRNQRNAKAVRRRISKTVNTLGAVINSMM